MTRQETIDLARKLRMDLTNAQGKLTEIIEFLDSLPSEFDATRICPTCELKLRGPLSLAEHIHTSHNGPIPPHYARAEELAGLSPD